MKNWIAILLALTFAISGILLLQNNHQTETGSPTTQVTAHDNTTKTDSLDAGDVPINPVVKSTPEQNTISVEVKDYLSHEALQRSVGEYFDNYSTLSQDTKLAQAEELNSHIEDLEKKGEIIPIEALSLKLALLKTTTSESDYPELAKNITEDYQNRISSEEPEIDYNKNALYKEQERQVLLEVQAMSQYPDGMSQSEYLRHRLQLLRAEIFEAD